MRDVLDWDELLAPYRQAVRELCVKFEAYTPENQPFNAPIDHVYGRVKHIGSIMDKAARKQITYENFHELSEQVEDIAGIRIICRFVEDIQRAAAIVRGRGDLAVTDERDYITNRKPSGYRSYHMHIRYTVNMPDGPKPVLAEIQIRTLAMNSWATIEHSLKYKYNGNLPEPLQERLAKSAEAAFTLDREMSTIRDDILEAQRVQERRAELAERILFNIKNLYKHARLTQVDELNSQFLLLHEEGDANKLHEFNQHLRTLAQLYQVEYI